MLCSSANELQQNSNASSREEYIPPISTVLLEIHHVYIWPSWPLVLCMLFVSTPSTNQHFWPDPGQILRHQCGISIAESQTLFLAKPQVTKAHYLCYVWVSYNVRKYGEHNYVSGKIVSFIFPTYYTYFVCKLRTTTTYYMVSFIDFYFHFLANFQTLTSPQMFSIFTHVIWNPYVTQIVSLGYLWRSVLSGEERVETAVFSAG